MEEFTQEIISLLGKKKYGNRSIMVSIKPILLSSSLVNNHIMSLVDIVAKSIANNKMLASTARSVAYSAMSLCDIDKDGYGDKAVISCGINILDLMSRAGLIEAELIRVAASERDKVKEQWKITSASPLMTDLVRQAITNNIAFNPTKKRMVWHHPFIKDNFGRRVPIVKKMDRYKIEFDYSKDQMPIVYLTLNKLSNTPWEVNKDMLALLSQPDFCLLPPIVKTSDKKKALSLMEKTTKAVKYVEDVKFQEFHKWLDIRGIEDCEELRKELAKEYIKEIVSSWSIRSDYENVLRLAEEWKDSELHFVHNCDSRGRVYALTPYLNPQGSDIAKSLLCFKNPKPISVWEFMVHIANCAGEDKGSFEDRIDWVQEHDQAILAVGYNPLGKEEQEWLKNTVGGEKKTKFQFIAACIEWARLHKWMEAGNAQDDFECRIAVGLDSTSSGLQLFSAIGLDAQAAPYVNISPHPSGKVGDLYAWLGAELCDELNALETKTARMEALLTHKRDSKIWRKLMKRLAMTYSYSAVAYGMGTMTYEDRKDHGYSETTNLGLEECVIIGRTAYEIAERKLTQAAKLMKFMRDGIDTISDTDSIVSWMLPSGFTAWQAKDISDSMTVSGEIGETKISLKVYVWKNKPNKRRHKNAISPDIIHSLDAYLLQLIVTSLPREANLHFIHDQFSTDSIYIQDIQENAKEAYLKVTERDVFRAICASAFNSNRELPQAGSWDRNDIHNADYIIC